MSEKHTCAALVIHCIDFRLQKFIQGFLAGEFPEGFDRIAIAGGIKDLFKEGVKRDYILSQIAISLKLHEPSVLVFLQHEDCGAYGGSANFASAKQEQEFHASELSKAAELLLALYPQIQSVKKYLAKLTGEIAGF